MYSQRSGLGSWTTWKNNNRLHATHTNPSSWLSPAYVCTMVSSSTSWWKQKFNLFDFMWILQIVLFEVQDIVFPPRCMGFYGHWTVKPQIAYGNAFLDFQTFRNLLWHFTMGQNLLIVFFHPYKFDNVVLKTNLSNRGYRIFGPSWFWPMAKVFFLDSASTPSVRPWLPDLNQGPLTKDKRKEIADQRDRLKKEMVRVTYSKGSNKKSVSGP